MSDIFDGGPAFPVAEHQGNWGTTHTTEAGLSKRELYALHCLPIARASFPDGIEGGWDGLCTHAFTIADAMLRAGSEPQPVQYRELYADEKAKLDAADRLAAAVEDVKKVSAYLAIPAALREPLERALEDVTEPTIPF